MAFRNSGIASVIRPFTHYVRVFKNRSPGIDQVPENIIDVPLYRSAVIILWQVFGRNTFPMGNLNCYRGSINRIFDGHVMVHRSNIGFGSVSDGIRKEAKTTRIIYPDRGKCEDVITT